MRLRKKMSDKSKESDAQAKQNFEENLIDAVQQRALLYDKELKSYRRKRLKQKAWADVAAVTGMSTSECQQRWRSLRDRFVREAKVDGNKTCKWRYLKKLQFLAKHLDSNRRVLIADDDTCSSSNRVYETPSAADCSEKEARMKFKTEVEIEQDSLEPFVSIPSTNLSLGVCEWNDEDKTRYDLRDEGDEMVDVEDDVSVASIVDDIRVVATKSRNEDYYKTLDSYMLKLPPHIQDDLKIDILNRVYNQIKGHGCC